MSYSISIQRDDEILELPESHTEGGTYAIGGTNEAEMTVTYNYSKIFRVGNLDGFTVNDALPILAHKVAQYGVLPADDYWAIDQRNIGHLCHTLMLWCFEALKQQPEGSVMWRFVKGD